MTWNRVVALAVVVALVAPVTAGALSAETNGSAGAGGAKTTSATTTAAVANRPQNVTYELEVDVSGGGDARVSVTASYPARSASEAERAAAGNLSTPWFDGEERVRRVFERTGDGRDELRGESKHVWHADEAWGREPRAPEHGWVFVEYAVGWNGFLGPSDERVVVGEASVSALDEGDRLVVRHASHWEPTTVRGTPTVSTEGGDVRYEWVVGDGDGSPKLVLDRSVLTATRELENDDSVAFGPAGGVLLAAVALLAFVTMIARR